MFTKETHWQIHQRSSPQGNQHNTRHNLPICLCSHCTVSFDSAKLLRRAAKHSAPLTCTNMLSLWWTFMALRMTVNQSNRLVVSMTTMYSLSTETNKKFQNCSSTHKILCTHPRTYTSIRPHTQSHSHSYTHTHTTYSGW